MINGWIPVSICFFSPVKHASSYTWSTKPCFLVFSPPSLDYRMSRISVELHVALGGKACTLSVWMVGTRAIWELLDCPRCRHPSFSSCRDSNVNRDPGSFLQSKFSSRVDLKYTLLWRQGIEDISPVNTLTPIHACCLLHRVIIESLLLF